MQTRFLNSPARAALMAVALASTGAMAQTADVAAPPPPTATVSEAAPPPLTRTITETVAPEALAEARAEQAAKAKPAAKPVARAAAAPVRSNPVAAPISSAPAAAPTAIAETDIVLPVAEAPTPVTETVATPAPEATAVDADGSNNDLMLYGGIAAALGLAGIGAAFASRRRKTRVEEDAPAKRNAMLEPTPRPMAPVAAAPAFVEPARTRIIEPAAPVVDAPTAAAAPIAATTAPVADPIFAKQAPVAQGVTDPLFTRKPEPLAPVTDPLFAYKAEAAPVTDPMFADRPDYAGPGSRGSRAAAIHRMRATDQGTEQSRVRDQVVDFV